MSGIGKTQLRCGFAEDMRGHARTVAVESGHGGHAGSATGYTTPSEHRFKSHEFTQAGYEPELPRFWHQPFFVVLDEMNLSHPEQYFSEVLSVLERKHEEQPGAHPDTAEVTPAPAWLREGRLLPLPDNIWFVGTANQDETTVGFAEKTLDRSNILE